MLIKFDILPQKSHEKWGNRIVKQIKGMRSKYSFTGM